VRSSWIAQVDDLIDRDFPGAEVLTRVDGQRAVSGPGFHLVAVLTSEDFRGVPDLLYVRDPEWTARFAFGVSTFV